MPDRKDWTYYLYGGLAPGDHVSAIRTWHGIAEGLNLETVEWVKINGDRISRYLETGEISLNEASRAEIESRLGVTLPD